MMNYQTALLGIWITAAAIVLIDLPYIRKRKLTKELWVFSCLLLLGVGLATAIALRLSLPNPMDWFAAAYRPFSDFLTNIGILQ